MQNPEKKLHIPELSISVFARYISFLFIEAPELSDIMYLYMSVISPHFRFSGELYIQKHIKIAYIGGGSKPFPLEGSSEEAVDLMKALMGMKTVVSNVNLPNRGQMPQMPLGSIVETNCVFSNDQVNPVTAKPLPSAAANLVHRCCLNVDTTYEGIKERDLSKLFAAFANQPLCSSLTMEQCEELFRQMCYNTREYLDPYFDLDAYFR